MGCGPGMWVELTELDTVDKWWWLIWRENDEEEDEYARGGPFVRCKAVKVLPLSATQKILQKRSELSHKGAFIQIFISL